MANDYMAALRRARTRLADLEEQQATATDTAGNLQARRQRLEAEIGARKRAADEKHALVMRGVEVMQAVETLRREQHEAERELALHADEERLCRDVQAKVDAEVMDAKRALAKTLEAAARAAWEPIEHALRANTKTRTQLIEIYALAAASVMPNLGGSGGRAIWASVLEDAFPEPTDAEFKAGLGAALRLLAPEE